MLAVPRTADFLVMIVIYRHHYYYYNKCHGLECCQSHSYGGTLQKSIFKTVAQLNADVCTINMVVQFK